ncbi:MAG: 3-dehydroquinate synthase [Spirochaetaceae bacterium]|jgi:3-dehydroquinate synthase|nr:3-dehydroquinate synthase [Spirochaetaceae bacterium]
MPVYKFGDHPCSVSIRRSPPRREELYAGAGYPPGDKPAALLVCDTNTAPLGRDMDIPRCVLPPGEDAKNWGSVEAIIRTAQSRGLGRDGLFIGLGGGVVCDLTAFAASVYMRGAALALVPTTLLCMVDACLGGKTGFDLGGIKNLAGTFYPAGFIAIASDLLRTLPPAEWKSGTAELIKTAILSGDRDFLGQFTRPFRGEPFLPLIERALIVKGRIVESDPQETGTERALLNLGHTFGHALEAALGLGLISHGEAVAWGIARACELGKELGITPPALEEQILGILHAWDYETALPYPRRINPGVFREALGSDKKKRGGKLRFVVPCAGGARLLALDSSMEKILEKTLLKRLLP